MSATMSCEVGPGSFATTRMPSICGRGGLSRAGVAASATVRFEHAPSLCQYRHNGRVDRLVDSRARGTGVAAAAERFGQRGRVQAAVTGADTDLCFVAV